MWAYFMNSKCQSVSLFSSQVMLSSSKEHLASLVSEILFPQPEM
jgi:hypothetical protein